MGGGLLPPSLHSPLASSPKLSIWAQDGMVAEEEGESNGGVPVRLAR